MPPWKFATAHARVHLRIAAHTDVHERSENDDTPTTTTHRRRRDDDDATTTTRRRRADDDDDDDDDDAPTTTRYARVVRWRLPDWVAFSEAFGGSEPVPRVPGRLRASVRRARFDAAAVWLGFGRARSVRRGLANELVAPVGTPVRAARRGVVRVRVSLVPGGVGLAVDHGDGSGSVWLHLARVRLAVGDVVEAGEPIGVVGASARAFVPAPWAPPCVIEHAIVAGEADSPEQLARDVDSDAAFDSAAVGDGIASCRDLRLRESMDALPTLTERAWALTFWRVAAPEHFVRGGRLR